RQRAQQTTHPDPLHDRPPLAGSESLTAAGDGITPRAILEPRAPPFRSVRGHSVTAPAALLTHRQRFVTLKRRTHVCRICSIPWSSATAARARLEMRLRVAPEQRPDRTRGEMYMTRTRAPLISALFALFASVFLAAVPAQQAAAPADQAAAPLQEVVVTGSRIPVPANITATSPTTIVSSQDIRLQ